MTYGTGLGRGQIKKRRLNRISGFFAGDAWTLNGITRVFSVSDPLGGSGAIQVKETATTSQHKTYLNAASLAVSGLDSIFRVRAKQWTRRYLQLLDATAAANAMFDLQTGAVFSSAGCAPNPPQDQGGGWWLLEIAGFNYGGGLVQIVPSTNGTTTNYLGTTSDGVYLFLPELFQ